MEANKKQNCSSKKHEDIEAIYYCIECKIYMCKKCESFHSILFQNHIPYNLDKNIDEVFTGLCKENGHFDKLNYFCKSHNELICAKCISKIKGKGNGQHNDCNVCFIEDIKEIKKNKLKENIEYLNNISKNIEQSFNELFKIYEKINENKENIKQKIQRLFTKIRNALNEREDNLLLEVDTIFNSLYFDEKIIKNNEKLPNKIKACLDKGKKMDNLWNEDNNLNSLINDCLNIENSIKEISNIDKGIKKYGETKNIDIKFYPDEDNINNFLNTVKNYGNIYYNNKCIYNLNLRNNISLINEKNNVLLISNGQIKILHNLLKYIKSINNLEIKSPEKILPNIMYNSIKNYKLLIIDLQDGGYSGYNNVNEIKQYLNDGGNIIVTHDQWTYNQHKGCAELLGAKLVSQNYNFVNRVRIVNNSHPIFTSFYQLDYDNQKIIEISQTHKTDTVYENKEEYNKSILMELEDGKNGEYLLIKEIGKGKLIFWNAGHTYNLTEYEQKLFINFIYFIFS